jgi:hypothetical protein
MTSTYRKLQEVDIFVSPGLQPDVRLKVFGYVGISCPFGDPRALLSLLP